MSVCKNVHLVVCLPVSLTRLTKKRVSHLFSFRGSLARIGRRVLRGVIVRLGFIFVESVPCRIAATSNVRRRCNDRLAPANTAALSASGWWTWTACAVVTRYSHEAVVCQGGRFLRFHLLR